MKQLFLRIDDETLKRFKAITGFELKADTAKQAICEYLNIREKSSNDNK